MTNNKARKAGFNLFGYGAIALYISILVLVAAGVYGFSLSTLFANVRKSERMREQLRTGRMVITTADRMQCRTLKFDNETAALGAETVTDCDAATGQRGSGGSFGVFRQGFAGH